MIKEEEKTSQEEKIEIPKLLPLGWIQELVKETGASRETIRFALRYNQRGPKSDKVRAAFKKLYGDMI